MPGSPQKWAWHTVDWRERNPVIAKKLTQLAHESGTASPDETCTPQKVAAKRHKLFGENKKK